MSFWDNIQSAFSRGKGKTKSSNSTSSSSARSYMSPLRVSPYLPLSIATVHRCVQLLSESVANLPMLYMRKKGDIFVPDSNARLSYLLNVQPYETCSAFDFWAQLVQNMLMEGNAYVVPFYNPMTMEFDRLVLCSRQSVSHDVNADQYIVSDSLNNIYNTYEEPDIIHVRGLSVDGKHGVSVLTYARLTMDIAIAGDRETLSRFQNGGSVRGVISNYQGTIGYGEYQDEQLANLASSVDSRFQGGERIVSLPGQVDFKQISLSSTDMQFLETRKFTVRDICRFFGVHPSFVFDDTSNNYKSAEMANVAFLSNTLNPILRKIENEFQRKLVSEKFAGKRRFQFDRRGLYACDLDSRVKYQTQTLAAGLYTVNEWRHEENKPPVEGGDRVFVSANLKDIEADSTTTNQDNQNNQDNQDNHENQPNQDLTQGAPDIGNAAPEGESGRQPEQDD